MSVGPASGLAGSVAGAPLAQTKGSDVERTAHDSGTQAHRAESQQKAEAASGIGQTDGEDHQTDERDADGRRPWEIPAKRAAAEAAEDDSAAEGPQPVKDVTGQSGSLLDLLG